MVGQPFGRRHVTCHAVDAAFNPPSVDVPQELDSRRLEAVYVCQIGEAPDRPLCLQVDDDTHGDGLRLGIGLRCVGHRALTRQRQRSSRLSRLCEADDNAKRYSSDH